LNLSCNLKVVALLSYYIVKYENKNLNYFGRRCYSNITTTKPEIEISILDYTGSDDGKPFVTLFKTDIVEDMRELFKHKLDKDELSAVNAINRIRFFSSGKE